MREEMAYAAFIAAKVAAAPDAGFAPPLPVSEKLFGFQRAIVEWALRKGRAAIFASFGLGKAQPVSEPVLTPTGWRAIGDLRVGDEVIAGDGSVTRVIGVYPQGERPVFEVKFSDGASTRCDAEHLWNVKSDGDAERGRPWRTLTLREIIDAGLSISAPSANGRRRWRVPVMGAADLPERELAVDPYVMGVLLGDGSFRHPTSVHFTSEDDEIAGHVAAALPPGMKVTRDPDDDRCPTYRLSIPKASTGHQNPIVVAIRAFGLWGRYSHEKWIPPEYLLGSIEQRVALLQGLCDTDGYVSKADGTIQFSTSSKRLAADAVALVRSLGGIARVSSKVPTYVHKGERREGLEHYTLTLALPNGLVPFRLSRKVALCRGRVKYPPARKIVSVEAAGSEAAVCIAVEHEARLYITRDYVVTHNTLMQLELARQVCAQTGGRFLIVAPLGVRQEFMRDAEMLGVGLTFIRRTSEAGPQGVYVTNYESVRDETADGSRKVDPREFDGASLDEASCLRGFGGTKTFREFMALFAGDDRRDMSQRIKGEAVRYRFVATATPSPNEFIELLAYSAFLDVMDVSTAKTRFFQRDSEKADNLTLHPHKVAEFWRWVASWAVFVTRPSDVSPACSDDGYALPPLRVRWHEIPTDHKTRAGVEKPKRKKGAAGEEWVQSRMFADAARGVTDAARESKASLGDRVAKMVEIIDAEPEEHFVVWHDLEDERKAIEGALPGVRSVYGSQDLDAREATILDFAAGRIRLLAAKPVMLGSGCNFQRHCRRAVFLGVGYKFNDFIQAIHRIYRFLQAGEVVVDIIYTEAQRDIRRVLEEKWASHNELVAQMTSIVREHGLGAGCVAALQDKVSCERRVCSGDAWELVNNDSVDEFAARPENSVGLIVTSIPFSTQYKYSDSYRDMGHTDTNEHFWKQMGYLTPSLLRCLKPGRIAAIHVKDRIVPGGMNGLGFQTVYPFHADAIEHYTRHGFAYMGMITVVTDVVRENAQTYRLGWTEQCKDGTKQGVGMPEYILLFRKPPTSNESAQADEPVVKSKDDYTRGRWQVDAHGYHRSSGNRFLTPADLKGLDHAQMYQAFAGWSRESVYDHEAHVALCDAVGAEGQLPSGFMLFQPQSWAPDVWADVARMRTLNMLQAAQDRVQHLCPMQFDIADRLITRFSMPGEMVCDPFSGLGTVCHQAVKLGRRGLGVELSPVYHDEAVRYLRALDQKRAVRTLFDLDSGAPIIAAERAA